MICTIMYVISKLSTQLYIVMGGTSKKPHICYTLYTKWRHGKTVSISIKLHFVRFQFPCYIYGNCPILYTVMTTHNIRKVFLVIIWSPPWPALHRIFVQFNQCRILQHQWCSQKLVKEMEKIVCVCGGGNTNEKIWLNFLQHQSLKLRSIVFAVPILAHNFF